MNSRIQPKDGPLKARLFDLAGVNPPPTESKGIVHGGVEFMTRLSHGHPQVEKICQIVRQMALSGQDNNAIAKQLNAEGFRTLLDKEFVANNIYVYRDKLKIGSYRQIKARAARKAKAAAAAKLHPKGDALPNASLPEPVQTQAPRPTRSVSTVIMLLTDPTIDDARKVKIALAYLGFA